MDIRFSDKDVYLPGMLDEIHDAVEESRDFIGDEAIRDLIDEARRIKLDVADVRAGTYLAEQQIRQEVTSTAEHTLARAERSLMAATGPTSSISQSLLALGAMVYDPLTGVEATAGALSTLTGRVAITEDGMDALSQDLVDLSAVVDGKASGTALNALTTRVTTAEGLISVASQDLVDLSAIVDGKASGTALAALTLRVDDHDGLFSSIAQDLVDLSSALDGKAAATAVNLLQTQVNEIDGEVDAHTTALTALNSQVGDIASSVTIRGATSASPGGGWARHVLEVKTESAEWSGAVGLYMDVNTNGQRRIMLDAANLVFGDLSSGEIINPLTYVGGMWRLNAANIGTVTAGRLESQNGKMVINLNAGTIQVWS